jgi:hypothetical protein
LSSITRNLSKGREAPENEKARWTRGSAGLLTSYSRSASGADPLTPRPVVRMVVVMCQRVHHKGELVRYLDARETVNNKSRVLASAWLEKAGSRLAGEGRTVPPFTDRLVGKVR